MNVDIEWLETHVFRRPLTDEESESLAYLTVHHYKRGETILAEGEVGGGMYIVRSGAIDITVNYEAQKVRLAHDDEGALFSKISLLEADSVSAATVIAESHCTVYKLSHSAFIEMLHHQKSLALLFLFAAISYQERMVQKQNMQLLPFLHKITKKANSLPLAIKLFPAVFVLIYIIAFLLIPTKY
jgi:CRP-like cAMP-binding protein